MSEVFENYYKNLLNLIVVNNQELFRIISIIQSNRRKRHSKNNIDKKDLDFLIIYLKTSKIEMAYRCLNKNKVMSNLFLESVLNNYDVESFEERDIEDFNSITLQEAITWLAYFLIIEDESACLKICKRIECLNIEKDERKKEKSYELVCKERDEIKEINKEFRRQVNSANREKIQYQKEIKDYIDTINKLKEELKKEQSAFKEQNAIIMELRINQTVLNEEKTKLQKTIENQQIELKQYIEKYSKNVVADRLAQTKEYPLHTECSKTEINLFALRKWALPENKGFKINYIDIDDNDEVCKQFVDLVKAGQNVWVVFFDIPLKLKIKVKKYYNKENILIFESIKDLSEFLRKEGGEINVSK